MKLNELKPGQSAMITRISLPSALKKRLEPLELRIGAEIEMIRVAPLGDPAEYRCGGSLIVLRRADARQIEVAVRKR